MLVNNLRDLESDARIGKRTLPVRIGARAGQGLYEGLVGLAFGASAMIAARGAPGVWLAFLSAPLALGAVRGVASARSGAEFGARLLDTARLHAVFGALYALGIAL